MLVQYSISKKIGYAQIAVFKLVALFFIFLTLISCNKQDESNPVQGTIPIEIIGDDNHDGTIDNVPPMPDEEDIPDDTWSDNDEGGEDDNPPSDPPDPNQVTYFFDSSQKKCINQNGEFGLNQNYLGECGLVYKRNFYKIENVSNKSFKGIVLIKVRFNNADFSNSDFSFSHFYKVKFFKSNLTNTNFDEVQFYKTHLGKSWFSNLIWDIETF